MAKTKKSKGKDKAAKSKKGKSKAIVVKRSVLAKFFVYLGWDMAEGWKPTRMMQKLPKAVELIDEDTKAKDKEVNALIKMLRDDPDLVEKIEIEDDEKKGKKAKGKPKDEKKAKGKKGKKSRDDDDDDDEDEDEDDEDEDEDEDDSDSDDDDDDDSDDDDDESDDDDDDDADEDESDDDDDEDSDDDEDDDDESDDDEEDEDMEDDDDDKKSKKKGKGKKGKAKSKDKASKKGGKKVGAPGVSSKIIEILKEASSSSPVTKKEVIKAVTKTFKGKDADEIKKRVGSVLRTSFMKRRGLKLASDDDGGFWLAKAKKSKKD